MGGSVFIWMLNAYFLNLSLFFLTSRFLYLTVDTAFMLPPSFPCSRYLLPTFGFAFGLVVFPAQADPYAGIALGLSSAEYRLASTNQVSTADPLLAQMQLGYFFNDYLALEGRYGTGVKRDKEINVDRLSTGLLKINVPVTPRLAFYGLAGYSSLKLDKKSVNAQSESGVSFGLGAHYALDKQSAVTAEFVNYLNGDEVRLSSFQLGIQFKF